MKNSLSIFVFSLLALVFAATLEEFAPKPVGVGFPILLSAVQHVAARRPLLTSLLFAVAAGAIEDALSALPMVTSASFFLAAVAAVKGSGHPRALMAFTYPLYQVWLWLWVSDLGGGVFMRFVVALPLGVVTVVAVACLLEFLERRAGVDVAA